MTQNTLNNEINKGENQQNREKGRSERQDQNLPSVYHAVHLEASLTHRP